jgi:hypothetical protein
MRKYLSILTTLFLIYNGHAQQGPSIRLDGNPVEGNILEFSEGRSVKDTGIPKTNILTYASLQITIDSTDTTAATPGAVEDYAQPLEDQRLSTTDSPSFVSVTASGNEVVYLTTYNSTNATVTTWYDPTNQVMRITLVEEAAE